jgi:serine/threonine protein kinase
MPTKLASDFLEKTQRSGLVAAEKLSALLEDLEQRGVDLDDPQAVADALIESELLTRWQVDNLLQGKHKGFFLGAYRLLKPLGRGGMGTVYLAQHEMMRRRCALKVLPQTPLHEGSSVLGRFYIEAQAVAALDHQNIVRAYDVNKETKDNKTVHYLVMEYVDGQDVQAMVQDSGPLDFIKAADFLRQTANGLAHAHENGLVHRDIKPANLLVDKKGVVKILDLGLARFFDDSAQASLTTTHNETVLGTADYLSPEQALNSHTVDHRTDIYSLGCTAYFMLTGHPPFPDGSVAQRLVAHQIKMPTPIVQERSDAPRDLVAIVDKMMAKGVDERFQNAGEISIALAAWLIEHGGDDWRRLHSEIAGDSNLMSLLKQREPTRAMSSASSDTELGLAPEDEAPDPSSASNSRITMEPQTSAPGTPENKAAAGAGRSSVKLGTPGAASRSSVKLGTPGAASRSSVKLGTPGAASRSSVKLGTPGAASRSSVKLDAPTAASRSSVKLDAAGTKPRPSGASFVKKAGPPKPAAGPAVPPQPVAAPAIELEPLADLSSLGSADLLGGLNAADLGSLPANTTTAASPADDWLQSPLPGPTLATSTRRPAPEPPKGLLGLIASIGWPIVLGVGGGLLLVGLVVLVVVLTRSGGGERPTSPVGNNPPVSSPPPNTQPPTPPPGGSLEKQPTGPPAPAVKPSSSADKPPETKPAEVKPAAGQPSSAGMQQPNVAAQNVPPGGATPMAQPAPQPSPGTQPAAGPAAQQPPNLQPREKQPTASVDRPLGQGDQPTAKPGGGETKPPAVKPAPKVELTPERKLQLLAGIKEIALDVTADEKTVPRQVVLMVTQRVEETLNSLKIKKSSGSGPPTLHVKITAKTEAGFSLVTLVASLECQDELANTVEVWSEEQTVGRFNAQATQTTVMQIMRSGVGNFFSGLQKDYRKATVSNR